ncbi:MAG TPA: hypothetical protein VFC33_02690 [Acidimicrobiia bacterium]|nr:hypothetical protein [Acidimicrobiia bacterium]
MRHVDDDDHDEDVRHVQPYEAVKRYRCPGCDHEIDVGVGHEVVVPRDAPDHRRHWHTPCWRAELRRRERERDGARRPRRSRS